MIGTAAYRERMVLPVSAVFEATLEDVSKADAPAEVIGKARVEHPGNPISFEILYDPAKIAAGNSYSVRGRITDEDQLLFTTTQRYPVGTRCVPRFDFDDQSFHSVNACEMPIGQNVAAFPSRLGKI